MQEDCAVQEESGRSAIVWPATAEDGRWSAAGDTRQLGPFLLSARLPRASLQLVARTLTHSLTSRHEGGRGSAVPFVLVCERWKARKQKRERGRERAREKRVDLGMCADLCLTLSLSTLDAVPLLAPRSVQPSARVSRLKVSGLGVPTVVSTICLLSTLVPTVFFLLSTFSPFLVCLLAYVSPSSIFQ